MATLAAQIVSSAASGIVNPKISTDLLLFGVDYWPPESCLSGKTLQGALTTHFPVKANGKSISGLIAHSFVQDWYNRIHVRPTTLSLGNVASTQVTTVEVWNAYFIPETLSAINGLQDGLTISGTIPRTFGGLQSVIYDLSINADGPGVLNAVLTWTFTDAISEPLTLTGTRVITFGFAPDWGDPIKETLSWLTDLMQSPSGAEQSRQLRLSPRREFDATVLVGDTDRQYFDLVTYGWGGRTFALPIWHDIQILATGVSIGASTVTCDTTNRDFRTNGIAILRGESALNSETIQIQSFTGTVLTLVRPTQQAWPAGSRLYPARSAELINQPAVTRITDRGASIDVQFRIAESSDWTPTVLPTTYRSFAVLEKRPDESDDLTAQYQRLMVDLDNSTGIPLRDDTAGLGFPSQQHAWLLDGPAEHTTFRGILYALAGRCNVVWVPSFSADLDVKATILAAATTIDVTWCGYTRFAAQGIGRRDIRIELGDVHSGGTVYHRRITASSEVDATTERLTIDAALGADTTVAMIGRVSFMALCRLDQDDIEIDHVTDIAGSATCALVVRGIRDDLT